MVATIGAVASASQGVSYYERDGYYATDDPAHKEASAWSGRGADALGLSGQVDPGVFKAVLEGRVPDDSGQRLGRRRNGKFVHRPGRDLTFSAPKSVSLAALVGGDERIVAAHDKAVKRTLGWVEKHVAETRLREENTGRMVRAGGQEMVAGTFRHNTSRNLDPQLHTHAVLANMLKGGDGKWRTMANEKLYASQRLIGAIYRVELAREVKRLGYGIEKTHADGRFEIAGVSRKVIEAFSTRRAAIVAAMNDRGLGDTKTNPRLAERAALMTRAHKRDVDHDGLRAHWEKQAEALDFDAKGLAALAGSGKERGAAVAAAPEGAAISKANGAAPSTGAASGAARDAVAWAVAHLSEREAVFSRTDLLAAALAWEPGAVT
ncbi:MAG: conjugative relaxase, partial [Rhodospirillales bacterium]|nr:conjugative relaxase [Rhodospirillales bacterium]